MIKPSATRTLTQTVTGTIVDMRLSSIESIFGRIGPEAGYDLPVMSSGGSRDSEPTQTAQTRRKPSLSGSLAVALLAIVAACSVQPTVEPTRTESFALSPSPSSASPSASPSRSPAPTPMPGVRTELVGTLAYRDGCVLLDAANHDEPYGLNLPYNYRLVRMDPLLILTRRGSVVATEGDTIRVDGIPTVSAGMYCMPGNRLIVSKIIATSPPSSDLRRVRCQAVHFERCGRAIRTATKLSPWPPVEVQTLTVHPGICAIAMFCATVDPRFITVEMTFAARDLVFVTIDMRNCGWAPVCNLLIIETSSSHTESCPASNAGD
jgi:hypothetical protein